MSDVGNFNIKHLGLACLCFFSVVFNVLANDQVNASASLCKTNIAKLTADANAKLKAGNPDKAFDMLYQCGPDLTDPGALEVKKQARLASLKKAEKNDPTSPVKLKAAKKREGVSIGMTKEDVVGSSWGRPRSINKTVTRYGTREQWVYDGGFLYFENEVLTTIQN